MKKTTAFLMSTLLVSQAFSAQMLTFRDLQPENRGSLLSTLDNCVKSQLLTTSSIPAEQITEYASFLKGQIQSSLKNLRAHEEQRQFSARMSRFLPFLSAAPLFILGAVAIGNPLPGVFPIVYQQGAEKESQIVFTQNKIDPKSVQALMYELKSSKCDLSGLRRELISLRQEAVGYFDEENHALINSVSIGSRDVHILKRLQDLATLELGLNLAEYNQITGEYIFE